MISGVLVFVLFLGSGAAALIYEVVWQQQLQLVIGSSTVSLGVLLAVYMGGLCAGSLLAPRLIPARHHPLRAYAALEAGVGVLGLVLLAAIPLATRFYVAWGGLGTAGVIMRALVTAVCLLPPTMLMGATLPAISRWVARTPHGMSRLGMFYTGNLAGAVLGTLVAGFYLLRLYDMNIAIYVAVSINLTVALGAWALARRQAANDTMASGDPQASGFRLRASAGAHSRTQAPGPVYFAIALSGFCALSAEVAWTRLLSLLFSATVYTFSIILAVLLIGLGVGSAIGSWLARVTNPRVALACCQIGSMIGIAWSAWALLAWLPFWPDATMAGDIWTVYRIDFVRAVVAILPAPIFWGASFPLALAAATGDDDSGKVVGRIYAANTVGAIAGALVTGLVLVSTVGSQVTQQIMIVAALLSAMVAFGRQRARALIAAAPVALIAAAMVPSLPPILVEYGRHAANWVGYPAETLFLGEGRHASIAVTRVEGGVLNYHNAGKIQASSQPPDMRLQRMLGHLTTIVPRHAKKVLVIGCGAGVTAGAVSVSPMVEQVTIVDIEPLVPEVAREYFGTVNHDVLKNPKVRVIADDARHFLMTTTETFDAITSDPLDPWVKGAATLYTKEFFETVRRRLNPGGVMTLFVQLYESSPEAVKSEVATFFSAFPEGMIFGNTFDGQAIDTVLVGPTEEPSIYLDYIDEALRQPEFARVVRSLGEINIVGATELFGNYAGRARDLQPWMLDAAINHDRDLRLQYLAGAGVNQHAGNAIYADILQYRTVPDDLFIASESTLWRLKQALDGVRE